MKAFTQVPDRSDKIFKEISDELTKKCQENVTSDAIFMRFYNNYLDCRSYLTRKENTEDTRESADEHNPVSLNSDSNEESFLDSDVVLEIPEEVWKKIDLRPRKMSGRKRTYPEPNLWTDVIFDLILKPNFTFLCDFSMTFHNKVRLCSGICGECGANFTCDISNVKKDGSGATFKINFHHPNKYIQHKKKRAIHGKEKRMKIADDVLKSGSISRYVQEKRLEEIESPSYVGKFIDYLNTILSELIMIC